jgi:prepilin-type processing-associated H-X9-DG protein
VLRLPRCQGLEAAFGTIPLGSNSSTGNGADSSGNGTGQNKWKPLGKAAGSDNRKYSSWIAHRPQLETTSGATALGNEANLGVHSGGANWLACDGHVKWLPGNQVSSGATPNAGINCPQDACLMTSGVTSGNGAGQSSATTDQMNGHPWVMTFSPF